MQIADEKALLEEIDARDRFEDAFADAYYLVMGEAIEWSNIYGTGEALYDMRRKLRRERAKGAVGG